MVKGFPSGAVVKNPSTFRDFPGGTVVKTPLSQYRGPGFDPWSGN